MSGMKELGIELDKRTLRKVYDSFDEGYAISTNKFADYLDKSIRDFHYKIVVQLDNYNSHHDKNIFDELELRFGSTINMKDLLEYIHLSNIEMKTLFILCKCDKEKSISYIIIIILFIYLK